MLNDKSKIFSWLNDISRQLYVSAQSVCSTKVIAVVVVVVVVKE